eukprot:1156048-Pelagomonas_calceolata.AAC.12
MVVPEGLCGWEWVCRWHTQVWAMCAEGGRAGTRKHATPPVGRALDKAECGARLLRSNAG